MFSYIVNDLVPPEVAGHCWVRNILLHRSVHYRKPKTNIHSIWLVCSESKLCYKAIPQYCGYPTEAKRTCFMFHLELKRTVLDLSNLKAPLFVDVLDFTCKYICHFVLVTAVCQWISHRYQLTRLQPQEN